MSDVWRDVDLAFHFENLTALLIEGEYFWRHHAFKYRQLPWEQLFPKLSQHLRTLKIDEVENLARDERALIDFMMPYSPVFFALTRACEIGRFDESPLVDIEPRDIPGRKWQQIRHFATCVPANNFAVLEWCAGKSHLGRTLVHSRDCAAVAVDFDAQLIAAGKLLAAREKVAIDFHCVDVLSDDAAPIMQKYHNAVALHACGDLHRRLLTLAAEKHVHSITLAPCCYQLIQDEGHYVLSQAGRASGLQLHRDDLRTAVQGTITAPLRETRRRQQLQAWRLGFDRLQRDVRGRDEYLPTPSLNTNVLTKSFSSFCRQLAVLKQIDLPDTIDYSHYENLGRQRLQEVATLDLPRIAFRRALELWLVLDRALFLRECNYRVEVGEFCAASLTPRNILISANLI